MATTDSTTPLLSPSPRSPKPTDGQIRESNWRWTLTPWTCGVITLLLNLGHRLVTIPLSRLFELNLCRTYYIEHDPTLIESDGNVEEQFCKRDNIQEDLAFYLGLIATLELVFELIGTIPLGYVSDKYGRRLVLYANIVVAIVAIVWYIGVATFDNIFPIQAIVAAPVLFMFAGGFNVAGAQLNAVVADIARGETQLTKIFGYTQSGSQIMQLLGPALSSASMMHNLWLPFWMGLGCLILVVPSIALLPETRRHLGKDREALDSLVHDGVVTSHMHLWEESKSLKKSIRLVVRKVYLQWKDFRLLMSSSRNFSLCLVIFLVTTLARGSQGILLQYVSKRYDKTFAEAGYTLVLKAAINFVLFTALIPWGLHVVPSWLHLSPAAANLLGLKTSLLLLLTGVFCISISTEFWMLLISFVIYSLGFGLNLFALALITHVATTTLNDWYIARTYAAVAIVETIGLLIGVPLLASVWIGAIKVGGFGLGLPWWLCGILYLSTFVAASFLKLKVEG